MDTAKFCGNCGTPFPRSPVPSSSLVNCPQGHIYSAVYEHCPYCPQADQSRTGGFETRIEGAETVIDTGEMRPTPPAPSSSEFETRLEGLANPFETRLEGGLNVSSFETRLEATPQPSEFETRLESGLRAPIDSTETVVEMAAPKFEPKQLDPTAIMPIPEEATVVEAPPPPKPAPPKAVEPPPPAPKPAEPKPAAAKPVDPTPPRPTGGIPVQGRTQPNLSPPAAPPASTPVSASGGAAEDSDRRTVVMAAIPDTPSPKGKGKIVGWLITYTKDQNGIDYRLYAGFNRIGAHPACDIVVDDDTVSGSHALIVYRDGRCLIKDELSRNGTFLNGAEVTESTALHNYDQIRVGNTDLTFVAAELPS
ncbi:MAG: FHA domain-containing protein [Acidobacteria bacterium]|nr:FHA domain-containing protein [Acidobacteriota bacterium]MCW5967309.1 FHA domain-containing protein [Blastocatellales bacterium]